MIFDSLENAQLYYPLSEKIKEAFYFIKSFIKVTILLFLFLCLSIVFDIFIILDYYCNPILYILHNFFCKHIANPSCYVSTVRRSKCFHKKAKPVCEI